MTDPHGDATLARVQLKGFDPDGALQMTRNFNDLETRSSSLAVNGLVRGGQVQVQANIRDADPARTGVVTVDAPVLLRPDLAVVELRKPPRAVRNSAVPIVGVVRELNGDLGAWADCVLYVNGVETDRAWGIWVDAGGTVTCTMMHMFRTVGESRVEIRVERVAPGDFDASNNSAAGTMPVIFVRSDFHYDAQFTDFTIADTSAYESSWSSANGRQGGVWSSEGAYEGRIQQSHLTAYLPRAIAFPIGELFGRQYTRDETAHQVLFRNLSADWTYEYESGRQRCVSRGYDQPMTGRGWLYVCSYEMLEPGQPPVGFTIVNYDRYAGDVTYTSRGHNHYWNRDLGIDDVYSYNHSGRNVNGRFVKYGLEYAFSVRLIDRGTLFTMNPFVGLLPFESAWSQPRTCWSHADTWGSSRYCAEYSSRITGLRGWVYGEPSR